MICLHLIVVMFFAGDSSDAASGDIVTHQPEISTDPSIDIIFVV